MKKIVLSFFLSIIAIVANAQQEGMYSITQEIKAKPGQQATMVVNLKNTIKFSGIQMKIKLPDGVEVAYDEDDAALLSLNSSRAKGFSTGVTYNPTTRLYYIDISHESKGIEPSEGEIFSLTFNVGKNAQLGTQNIEFTACEFADMDLVSYDQDDFTVPFIIYDNFSVSATTANETMGSVKIEPSGDAVESGTSITATATPNDGYIFVNWTSGETKVSTDNPYTFELAAATALTANFKAIQYPVVFKNDGAEVTNENIDFASVITAPKNPTKEGYTFLGWFDGNDVKFVEGATVPLNGVTYTAKWQINQYTITFDTDGGSEIAAMTQDYNTAVTAPAAPTKTGYTFVSWDKEIPATMPAENITIKAIWQINKYTVTFDSNGGTEVAPINQDYATEINAPTAPTRVGYEFAGWDKEIPATMPAEDLTLTAQWTAKKFIYTFTKKDNKDNLASDVIELEQTFDAAVVMPTPEQLNWEGHTFDKYVETVPETVTEEGAKTFTALYNINKYTVKFVVGEVIHEATLEYGSPITIPEIPAKEGYTGAWDKEVAKTVPAENVTYTAVYTPIEYTVTFNTDGGSEVASIKVTYGSAITLPEKNPTKEGYTFKEWGNVPATMPANDVELKAIWTINKYNVTFDFGFDGLVDTKDYEYNAEIVIPDVPSRAGWVFKGWEPEVAKTVPASDVTYTAQWELDVVKVRFVFWDGNTKEYEYKPGAEITEIPEVPAREGYTFKGWDKEIPDVVPETGGILVITAQWSINKYAVYFIANKKTVYSAILPYGSEIVAPEAPEVEGYTFVGWTPEVDATVPARTVYYEAVYEVNTYKVTYYLNDEVVNVAEVKYGEAIPAYEPTVEEGMKFDGWQEEIPAVMPAYDLEIHGTTSGIETAIKNIVAKFGESFDVYNVSGRLVQRVNGASDISRIPAGMYIINGTKVVIRKD